MKNYENPKDGLATTGRYKTHLHSEVIMIMHITHLNLKLESFKNPPIFQTNYYRTIGTFSLSFSACQTARPSVKSQPTFLSATQIPAGYHQIQRAVDAVALAGAGSVSDAAPPCWLIITCLYNGARP